MTHDPLKNIVKKVKKSSKLVVEPGLLWQKSETLPIELWKQGYRVNKKTSEYYTFEMSLNLSKAL